MSLNEMSLKSRTETSARWRQEKEGGSHHQHTYSTASALTPFRNAPNQTFYRPFPLMIIIRGLDESPKVLRFVRASIYGKPEPSKSG